MTKFWAILKDSFREAVDGYVIYVMLGLAAVLMLVLASLSFAPAQPEKALARVTSKFVVIFPDRGANPSPTAVPFPVSYTPSDVRETPDGVRFRLGVSGGSKPGPAANDGFRNAVFAWASPPGEKVKNPFGMNRRGKQAEEKALEMVAPPKATEAGLAALTTDDMTAFVRGQFLVFGAAREVEVTRVTDGVSEPNYRFDVELRGVRGAPGWPHTIGVFFGLYTVFKESGGVELGAVLYGVEDILVNGVGAWVALLVSVVITAFFIPNMLRKGSVDLLVSKPIGRPLLLVYKYLGGLTFIFLLSAVTIGGVWLVLAVRSGNWNPAMLLVVPALTFAFAILYAVSTLVAVTTRSAIAAIMLTLGAVFGLFVVGKTKQFADENRVVQIIDIREEWVYTVIDVIHAGLPRYKDLDRLTRQAIVAATLSPADGRLGAGVGLIEQPSWGSTIGVSCGFIAVLLGLSCWRFSSRDY
jgi:ABC-type transport system involved in multi-copper enzyme maturation permease subunit